MDIKNSRDMRKQAKDALASASYNPRKLALIHGGVMLGISLLITLVNFLLSKQIDSATGLSGLGTRTTLGTIQSILQIANTVLMPFWEIGFLAAAVNMVRKEQTGPRTLLSGFHRLALFCG